MRSVMFTFRPDTSLKEQDRILEKINTWEEVEKAARLKPDARRSEILRMAHAYIKDGVDVEAFSHRLSEMPQILSASLPAERHLSR